MNPNDTGLPAEDQPRSAPDVARRCIALYAVLAAGHNEPRSKLVRWLKREGLWDAVSPEEAAFLESKAPDRRQIITATWRAEALFPLLWALGKIPVVTPGTGICDVARMQSVLPGVIRERHHALNWLIGYCGQDWDDVTTDT